MAQWISANTPVLVRKYLQLEQTPGVRAER